MNSEANTGAESQAAPEPENDSWISRLDSGHALIAGVALLLTTAMNLVSALEKQWQVSIVTLGLFALGTLLYLVSYRRARVNGSSLRWRRAASATLILIFPAACAVFVAFTVVPRLAADGPIIAVARFDGPTLPAPYADCRPSAMLANSLAGVSDQYRSLTVFELPYVVNPDGRWGHAWASLHGMLEAADVVVYGEYSFVDSKPGSNQPDRLLIWPHVNAVPLIPLSWKVAPLMQWQFLPRIVPLVELCTGTAIRFVGDGRRLGEALAALQLLAKQDSVGAQGALIAAESPDAVNGLPPAQHSAEEVAASRCDVAVGSPSECSSVLAFYLAMLEQRFGHYDRAVSEYEYAAAQMERAPAYINLAQLFGIECKGQQALHALKLAVAADPQSVGAVATLSAFEYEYDRTEEATEELDAAKRMTPRTTYDLVALSQALHQRSEPQLKAEGVALLRHVLENPGNDDSMVDTRVEYAAWLLDAKRENAQNADIAIRQLRSVLASHPRHIKANYELALALRAQREQSRRTDGIADVQAAVAIRESFLAAVNAVAYSDDDLTTQGNAASELGRARDARAFYARALNVNPRSVYAYSGLGALYEQEHNIALATRNYRMAATLHPAERWLEDKNSALLSLTKPAVRSAARGSL